MNWNADDGYDPYGPRGEDDFRDDDDYDDYVTDWEYHRSLMNPLQRARDDISWWFWNTRIGRRIIDYQYHKRIEENGDDEFPF